MPGHFYCLGIHLSQHKGAVAEVEQFAPKHCYCSDCGYRSTVRKMIVNKLVGLGLIINEVGVGENMQLRISENVVRPGAESRPTSPNPKVGLVDRPQISSDPTSLQPTNTIRKHSCASPSIGQSRTGPRTRSSPTSYTPR